MRHAREVTLTLRGLPPSLWHQAAEEMSTAKVQDGELMDDHLTDEMKSIEVSHTLTPQLSAHGTPPGRLLGM